MHTQLPERPPNGDRDVSQETKAMAEEGEESLTDDPPRAVDLEARAAGTWQDQGGSAALLCPGRMLQGPGGPTWPLFLLLPMEWHPTPRCLDHGRVAATPTPAFLDLASPLHPSLSF